MPPTTHVAFAQMGAHRIGMWFDKAVQGAPSEDVALEYMELAILRWPLCGRGLPVEYDSELMDRAKRLAPSAAPPIAPSFTAIPPAPPPPPAAVVPASQPKSDGAIALNDQLDQMVKGIEGLTGQMATFGRRLDATHSKLDNVSNKVGGLETKVKDMEAGSSMRPKTKEEKDKTIRCNKCGQIGHREADCPN